MLIIIYFNLLCRARLYNAKHILYNVIFVKIELNVYILNQYVKYDGRSIGIDIKSKRIISNLNLNYLILSLCIMYFVQYTLFYQNKQTNFYTFDQIELYFYLDIQKRIQFHI